jgi:hypothetical protein
VLLGTDQPVRHAGTFFTGDGTNVNSHGPAFKLDTALLSASAPLIALTNSILQVGTSASTPNGIDLANRAKMTVTLVPGDAMVMLNNSHLIIANGHGTNVAGGSFLKVLGDFLRMANGSSLTISNGSALNISGGSSVSISGAFVNFVGTGNVINLTNSLCATFSCQTFNGVRVAFANGASPTNVTIGANAITGAGGVINASANAAGVLLNGITSKVKIAGP